MTNQKVVLDNVILLVKNSMAKVAVNLKNKCFGKKKAVAAAAAVKRSKSKERSSTDGKCVFPCGLYKGKKYKLREKIAKPFIG